MTPHIDIEFRKRMRQANRAAQMGQTKAARRIRKDTLAWLASIRDALEGAHA